MGRVFAAVLFVTALGACQKSGDNAIEKPEVTTAVEVREEGGYLAESCRAFGEAFAQRAEDRETFMRVTSGLDNGSMSVAEAGRVMSEAILGGPVVYYQSLVAILMEVERDSEASAELRATARAGAEWYTKKMNQSEDAAIAVIVVETQDEFYAVFDQLSEDAPADYFGPEMDAYLEREPACREYADALYNVRS